MGGLYHIETSLLIYSTGQPNGFYMIGNSVMKKLNVFSVNMTPDRINCNNSNVIQIFWTLPD